MKLSEKQQYELLAAISARGEIPTKFIYLDGGEKLWDAVYKERSQDDGMADKELDLLLDHVPSIANVFRGARGINLIDLGCGNGLPAIALIKKLLEHQQFKIRYIAVDISAAMLELAISSLRREFPDIEIDRLLIDFEAESLTQSLLNIKQHTHMPNLLLDLGNTLGNHVNVNSVLTNFLESMTLEDYLLIGNGLANDYNPQRILKSYTEAAKNLTTHPAQSLGLYNDEDEFKFVWNPTKNRVEGRIRLNSNKQIVLAGQTIDLEADDELMVMQSNKYSESSLTRLLSGVGFRTELLTTTKTRDEILAMVQPTRYSAA